MWDIPDKVANNGVSLAGKHTHGEYNNRQHELEMAVTHMGVALSTYPADPNVTSDANEEALAESMTRAASLGVYAVDSGAANAYVLAASGDVVAPKALIDGLAVWLMPGHTNTTASTANAFGLGVKAVRSWDDSALVGGEIIVGRPTAWRYKASANSGAGAWMIDPWASALSENYLITTAITITIGGAGTYDQPTLAAALEWLARRRITTTGSVIIQLPSGQVAFGAAVVTLSHPDGQRITLQGAALTGGGFPTDANITITGSSSGARTTDTAAALTVLRARIPSEYQFTGAGQMVIGNWGLVKNLLVTCSSTPTSAAVMVTDRSALTNVAVVSAGDVGVGVSGLCTLSGVMAVGAAVAGVYVSGLAFMSGAVNAYSCGSYGIYVRYGALSSSGTVGDGYARGNGVNGLHVFAGTAVIVGTVNFSTNATCGVYGEQANINIPGNSTIANNSNTGVGSYNGSRIVLGNVPGGATVSITGSSIGFYATVGSLGVLNGTVTLSGNTTNLAPTANTVGNSNSYIYQ